MLLLALAFLYLNYNSKNNHDHDIHDKHANSNKDSHHEKHVDSKTQKSTDKLNKVSHDHSDKTEYTAQEKDIIKKTRSLSYEKETERVREMTKNYPKSREEIIQFVSKNDPYKEANIAVKPHTVDSIKQNQIGALKVLALKNVHLKETNNQSRIKFYEDLLSKAKDPTIVKILKASIDSAKQGRDFSKDFLDGVENQPLEN